MQQIVDLTKPIKEYPDDPWFMKVKIKHKPHHKAKWLIRLFGLPFKLFPKSFVGWADDTIEKMGVHATTHIDAPWHYTPSLNGEKAKTIEQIPLDICHGEGLVIDMCHKPDFDPITAADIQSFLTENDLELKPGMIVLIKTGRDKLIGTKDYPHRGTGMSAEATRFLIEAGVKVMGIDSWGWDIPLKYQIKKAKQDQNDQLFWEAHLVGQQQEYWHMEQLVNLDALPLSGFKVGVFPLKIVGASAAPARVVAFL
ncbi:cyclase family protein [Persicobacter sp. CCB-QB2]|uniref:cyclase family protein n=1 Tax=Persicobacter sp. CCB-QB2 TaxID=1561025 RepID=UPI0006A972FA|nr:cyclase family protein [Persicobacter sp. CCB-QB2]